MIYYQIIDELKSFIFIVIVLVKIMKMSILIHLMPNEEYFVAETCWPTKHCGQNVKVIAQNRKEAFSQISKAIPTFIESFGRQYIDSWANYSNKVNCPEGIVEMPIDLWCCKKTKNTCPIQAQIDLINPNEFFENCLLSEEKRNGIFNAIEKGSYKGFHHVVGRYQCGTCNKSKIYFNFHYPWELTHLSKHCDIESIWFNDIERAKDLIRKNMPRSAIYSALCCDCFKKIAKLFPEIDLSEYETISYNYQRS